MSERTVESLHEQLTMLNSSDAIERAREQHDVVLSATNQRHEAQVLELTTQLDGCRQNLAETVSRFSVACIFFEIYEFFF